MFLKLILILSSLCLTLCDERGRRVRRIVGGRRALVPPADDPVVYTRLAGRFARIQGVISFPHYVFRGIKYAQPPTGRDRFMRPSPKFLEGEVNATEFPLPCIQPLPGTNSVVGSEDCLALNVFTPELPTGLEGLPVIVWIHGGGFRYGSASQYGARHLVSKRLVVVTIQYRLGSLGFISSGTKQLPGNVALWDMVLAIQWVRKYIGFFGGNPFRITVMGQDSGASSAVMIALSNVAKGLPAGVVAMSGTAVSKWAIDSAPQDTAKEIAIQNNCPTASAVTMVKCLQNLPAESIIRGDSNIAFQRLQARGFMAGLSGGLNSAPVNEGRNDGRSLPGVIEDEPMNDLERKKNPKIPLLTGVCRDETKRAVRGYLRKDVTNKLNTVRNFLDNQLVKNLQGLVPSSPVFNSTPVGRLIPLQPPEPISFVNYLQYKKSDVFSALDKVAEITGDVLFSVPAFLTVDRWSKNGASSFLYSFEHIGKLSKGSSFLKGCPLLGNETEVDTDDTVGHGDELAYLFEVNDVKGNPLEAKEDLGDKDKQVRDFFTQIISDFARYGKVRINDEDVQPFDSQKNNFIQITDKPAVASGFKFCQMGLWCGLTERLKSKACLIYDALRTPLETVFGKNITSEVEKPVSRLTDTIITPLGRQQTGNKQGSGFRGGIFG